MKKPLKQQGPHAGLVESFRKALHVGVEWGPQKQESEKNRFLARLEPQKVCVGAGEKAAIKRGIWIPVTASAATVLVALGLWLFAGSGPRATAADGLQLAGLWRITAGDSLSQGQSAFVPPGMGAKIAWPDGTVAWLSPQTSFSLSADNSDALRLESGQILFQVTPRQGTKHFQVETQEGTIVVLGTVFSVEKNEQRLKIRLHKGKVSLRRDSETLPLDPGTAFTLDKTGHRTLVALTDADVLHDLLIAERTLGLGGLSSPDIDKDVEWSSSLGDAVALSTHDSKAHATRARALEPAPRLKKSSGGGATSELGQPEMSVEKKRDHMDPELEGILVETVEEDSAIESLREFGRNQRYEEGVAAARRYLSAHPHGPRSEEALFLLGTCQMRAGKVGDGRRTFQEYLVAFPHGRYAKKIYDILGE